MTPDKKMRPAGCIDDIHGCNVAGQLSGDYDVMDTVGHGTHCAGIAAASHNNSVGGAASSLACALGRMGMTDAWKSPSCHDLT